MNARAAVGAQLLAVFCTVVAIFTAAVGMPSWVPVLAGLVGFFFLMVGLTYLVPAATRELEDLR